jgi:hypothetical protein
MLSNPQPGNHSPRKIGAGIIAVVGGGKPFSHHPVFRNTAIAKGRIRTAL